MKNLINQLNELEAQLLFIQKRLIQLSLFEEPYPANKSKLSRELRNSVNFFMQSKDPLNKKIGAQYREIYNEIKKKSGISEKSPLHIHSSFSCLAKVLSKNQHILD